MLPRFEGCYVSVRRDFIDVKAKQENSYVIQVESYLAKRTLQGRIVVHVKWAWLCS